MPSDVAQDATAQRGITPLEGKGTLGTWRALCLAPDSGPEVRLFLFFNTFYSFKMKRKQSLYFIIIVLAIFLSYSVFLIFDNHNIILLTKEDGLFESLGAISFLIASIIFFLTFLKDKSGNDFKFFKTKKNIFFLLLGITFFLGFAEEISWGQRIFNLSTPEILNKYNIQKEMSIHNLTFFQVRTAEGRRKSNWALLLHINVHFILFSFIFCILIPILYKYQLTLSHRFRKINFPEVPLWLGIFFLVNLVISRLLCVYISGDLQSLLIITGDIPNAIMEVEEFNFALFFLLVAFYLFGNTHNIDPK